PPPPPGKSGGLPVLLFLLRARPLRLLRHLERERDLEAAACVARCRPRGEPPAVVSGLHRRDSDRRAPPAPPLLPEACRRGGLRLLLCGHHHAYQRYRPIPGEAGDLTLVVSGGGGANLSSSAAKDSRRGGSALPPHL